MQQWPRRSASWTGADRALERYPYLGTVDVPSPVMAALCDDLNTPLALSAMHGLADKALAGEFDAACGLRAAGKLLGIVQQSVDEWFRGGADRATVEAAIADRQEARRRRDYKRADAIRAEWSARGVVFEDRPDGTTSWSVVAGSDGR